MAIPIFYQWATSIMSEVRLALATRIPWSALTKQHVDIFGLPSDRLASVREVYRRAQYQRAKAVYAQPRMARAWRDYSPARFEEEAGSWMTSVSDMADRLEVDVDALGRSIMTSDKELAIEDLEAY